MLVTHHTFFSFQRIAALQRPALARCSLYVCVNLSLFAVSLIQTVQQLCSFYKVNVALNLQPVQKGSTCHHTNFLLQIPWPAVLFILSAKGVWTLIAHVPMPCAVSFSCIFFPCVRPGGNCVSLYDERKNCPVLSLERRHTNHTRSTKQQQPQQQQNRKMHKWLMCQLLRLLCNAQSFLVSLGSPCSITVC